MNFKKDRTKFRTINQRFRRARRLYVFMMRDEINENRNDMLDYMVIKMKERGLYSKGTDDRGCRQSIISHLFRVEVPKGRYGNPWYEWTFQNGWDVWRGYSKPIMRKEA